MDEEIEDLVGDVKCTDSQKSVATSNVYSLDFTDSSSDKHNSSGKETYVIECDDSDDSEKPCHLRDSHSVVNLQDPQWLKQAPSINKISTSTSDSFHISQEIFTQTSKTIIELAETEGALLKAIANKTLETQTSFISISENKTVEYRIQVTGTHADAKTHSGHIITNIDNDFCNPIHYQILTASLDEGSSKFPVTDSENERPDSRVSQKSDSSISSNNDKIINIIDDKDFKTHFHSDTKDESHYDNSSAYEKSDSDMDEDSLMCNEYRESKDFNGDNTSDTSEVPKSVDSDVEDLYKKLSEKINVNVEKIVSCEPEMPRFCMLSPLTEESEKAAGQSESLMDITPDCSNLKDEDDKYVVFTNSTGVKVKALPSDELKTERDNLKLPPIKKNQSCPNSPHLNFLFSGSVQRSKPYSFESQREWGAVDRWEMGTKDLAAGESPLISGRSDPSRRSESLSLPPIHAEGHKHNVSLKASTNGASDSSTNEQRSEETSNKSHTHEPISIKDKITELKMSSVKHRPQAKFASKIPRSTDSKTSRSASPGSTSLEDSRLGDVAERGCDTLCAELLRRLRSASWFEVADTLDEIPRVMKKFWRVISEHRVADLIRQVSSHVDSPRTQVARSACQTLACILKNTNYTKKPDFYEAVTTLLVKTGSFSRPVRRAANVALDGIVCGVELTHAVTALCVHGVGHKSPLVRCAAARLLVVCCALAGGGRDVLRTRPPSAVVARRHALRALAALLEDKATETRKYAERLYSMLRPLANFEAFYLTDVEVEVAARQMKRFDRLLLCGPPGETR